MTWVVQLPEGSRPGKHEILVPEGEVDLFSDTISGLHFKKMKYKMQGDVCPDMEFVQNFTPPDFQAKNFIPSISPNFNNFNDKNTKK